MPVLCRHQNFGSMLEVWEFRGYTTCTEILGPSQGYLPCWLATMGEIGQRLLLLLSVQYTYNRCMCLCPAVSWGIILLLVSLRYSTRGPASAHKISISAQLAAGIEPWYAAQMCSSNKCTNFCVLTYPSCLLCALNWFLSWPGRPRIARVATNMISLCMLSHQAKFSKELLWCYSNKRRKMELLSIILIVASLLPFSASDRQGYSYLHAHYMIFHFFSPLSYHCIICKPWLVT